MTLKNFLMGSKPTLWLRVLRGLSLVPVATLLTALLISWGFLPLHHSHSVLAAESVGPWIFTTVQDFTSCGTPNPDKPEPNRF